MFDDDLIFDDFPRYIANLKDSRETKETFDTLSISATTNYIANLKDSREKKETFDNLSISTIINQWDTCFWDIPISGNDLFVTSFSSADKGPLAGIVSYCNCYQLYNAPSPGAAFEKIPEILRQREQWIWLASPEGNNTGRHIPHLCRGVKESDGLSKSNWMRFIDIGWSYRNNPCGNAYVINDEEIIEGLRLVAIEISPQSGLKNDDVKQLWMTLGKPYLEYSKDCHGWTILGLVNQQLPTINCSGVKIFTGGDFVELSGLGAEGNLVDITKRILSSHAYRFLVSKYNASVERHCKGAS